MLDVHAGTLFAVHLGEALPAQPGFEGGQGTRLHGVGEHTLEIARHLLGLVGGGHHDGWTGGWSGG